ncbi:MAG: hypothetical protein MJ215_04395, partial [Spirochaetia bacterium]|nr:hypothetical protein [Spirochaetia bacterium]
EVPLTEKQFPEAVRILGDFSSYDSWILNGLKDGDDDAKNLICTLNSIRYIQDKELFKVGFSLHVWPFKGKNYSIPMLVRDVERDDDGNIMSFQLEADKHHSTHKLIENLVYSFELQDGKYEKKLKYNGICKMRGLARAIFTLRMYRRNIEVYICRFAENFLDSISI